MFKGVFHNSPFRALATNLAPLWGPLVQEIGFNLNPLRNPLRNPLSASKGVVSGSVSGVKKKQKKPMPN